MGDKSAPDTDRDPQAPQRVRAEDFHQPGTWANINRAPYDEVAGVLYKRVANLKEVAHTPADPAPELPPLLQGEGTTHVRWLFSEQPGTEEGLLAGATFAYLQDVTLEGGAGTGMASHKRARICYTLAGEGELQHRATPGSPIVVRPLRPGDVVLIQAGVSHRVQNKHADETLRLIILGLTSDHAERP